MGWFCYRHGGPPCQCVKAREPDPYDGTDPSKLHAFLSQCKLVFCHSPQAFMNNELKIMYTISYLKGTALQWFELNLSLNKIDLPLHAHIWTAFEYELKSTFGEPDPIALATLKLDNLTMKDSHDIARYNVDFNKYSTLTGFDQCMLHAKYYKGLAPCIKDTLIFAGCPNNLDELCTQAQELNLCYWECKEKDCATAPSSGSSSVKPSSLKSHGSNASASTSQSSKTSHAQP